MRKVHFLMKCTFILMKCKKSKFLTLSSLFNLGLWNQLGPHPVLSSWPWHRGWLCWEVRDLGPDKGQYLTLWTQGTGLLPQRQSSVTQSI